MGREEGSKKMKNAIIHPDLGIGKHNVLYQAFNEGGAERLCFPHIMQRLIVDAAVELASYGHKVHVFTSHRDKSRCFEETLCGGYDERLKDNEDYLEDLKSLAEKGVSNRVNFITSCSTNQLLSTSLCVLYAPTDEHFGIVSLEAMAAYKPVIACNSGGPVDTVKNGVIGYLCEPTPEDFSSAMAKFIETPELAKMMGSEARKHVVESFSVKTFGEKLNQYLVDVVSSPKQDRHSSVW